jgi:hypothetical protein
LIFIYETHLISFVNPIADLMKRRRTPDVVVAILLIALLTCAHFLIRELILNFEWKLKVFELATIQGSNEARRDFESKKLRLLVIAGNRDEERFSGTNDGPYEVWFPAYSPELPAFRYGTEIMVDSYNYQMRWLHDRAEVAKTNATGPQANRVKPDSQN